MSAELLPAGKNAAVAARSAPVALEPVAQADTVAGTPRQGVAELGQIAGADVGIWELRGGTVTDTEVDELFVVLSGGATIEFLGEPGEPGEPSESGEPGEPGERADGVLRSLEVRAGDAVRLTAGSRTRWTVPDHIRKIYIAAS